jgi:hypothetical protein
MKQAQGRAKWRTPADRSNYRIQAFRREDGTLTLPPIVRSVAQGVDVMLALNERRIRPSNSRWSGVQEIPSLKSTGAIDAHALGRVSVAFE